MDFLKNILLLIREQVSESTTYYRQTNNSWVSVHGDKGKLGEYRIFQELKTLRGHKRFLFNVYIPKEDGITTEIDVILLHESGIYVFESKNFSGWIFGSESQKYWTQTLPVGYEKSEKFRFYNPIWQNRRHVKLLRDFLDDPILPLYSYVVFGGDCELKTHDLGNENEYIVYLEELFLQVRRNIENRGQQLSSDRIEELYEKLYPLTQISEAEKAAHVERIKGFVGTPLGKEGDVCPRCGGKLVKRVATKGGRRGKSFLGCSNYPHCHYMADLESEGV